MTKNQACERCGATIETRQELQGLCAACLLKASLQPEVVVTGNSARRPAPTLDALAPHFPDLEFLAQIGQGGMGAVYRVRQRSLGREAALKVLSLDTDIDPAFGERFEREARLLASIEHPNIVSVYGAGKAGPHWYLLMELVEGASLRQMIAAREADPRAALAIVGQVCDALQAAHDRGVVHRDIKPENVIVTRKGQAKILDFGLAKLMHREPRTANTLTEAGQVMGTVRYMAPEQWERPLSVDHRADIYSLGVVLYELLTGELPLGRFPLPSQKAAVGASVDQIVLKTLEKEPAQRYQQASEVRADVTRAAGAGSAPMAPTAPPPITGDATGSSSTVRTLMGIGVVGLALAAVTQIALACGLLAGRFLSSVEFLFVCVIGAFAGVLALGLWLYIGRPWPRARWAQLSLVLSPLALWAGSYALGSIWTGNRMRLLDDEHHGMVQLTDMLDREYPWCPPERIAAYSREPDVDARTNLLVTINNRQVEKLVSLKPEGFLAAPQSAAELEERKSYFEIARAAVLLHYSLFDSSLLDLSRASGERTTFVLPAMPIALARNELAVRIMLAARRDGDGMTKHADDSRVFLSPSFTWLGAVGQDSSSSLVAIDMAALKQSAAELKAPEQLDRDRQRLDELFGLDQLLEFGKEPLEVDIRNPHSSTPTGSLKRLNGSVRELTTAELQGRYAMLLHLARS